MGDRCEVSPFSLELKSHSINSSHTLSLHFNLEFLSGFNSELASKWQLTECRILQVLILDF